MKIQSFRDGRLLSVLCGILFTLACCSSVMAQSSSSSIHGTVTDPQGNVVAGATVTLTNAQKNFSRTQTTTDGGSFAFNLIPPDQYTVETQAQGFKKSVLTSVSAQVAKATDLNVQLEIGNVAETVTVSSGAGEALINRQDATLGNNFVSQQIAQLPLEARNPERLGDALMLLLDGGYFTRLIFPLGSGPISAALHAVRALIEAHLPPKFSADDRPDAARTVEAGARTVAAGK